jgi:3-demethoxyubiquinol 3-hydroxylase
MNNPRHTILMTLAAGKVALGPIAYGQTRLDDIHPRAVRWAGHRRDHDRPQQGFEAFGRVGLVQHLDQEGLMLSSLITAAQTGAGVAPGSNGAGLMMAPGHTLPSEVVADLRTDHAGETGAVCIYHGVLRFARDPMLRSLAYRHLATEQAHLQQIEGWLAPAHRSRLLPAWRLAGWLTGALPALLGPRAVYCTIETVEQFVDQHYDEQIRRLEAHPALGPLRQTLLQCQGDEVAHREEAAAARGAVGLGVVLRAWCWVVAAGSRGAVAVCRHI